MKYFVTETYIKSTVAINPNLKVEHIVPFTQTVAEMWVRPILGVEFYDHLLAAFNAQTLTPDEEKVVGYIKPCVAWRAASEAVISTSYQVTAKGVQKQNGDNSESAEFSEIAMVQGMYIQKAEFYESFLMEWLKENKSLFPLYKKGCGDDTDNYHGYFRII